MYKHVHVFVKISVRLVRYAHVFHVHVYMLKTFKLHFSFLLCNACIYNNYTYIVYNYIYNVYIYIQARNSTVQGSLSLSGPTRYVFSQVHVCTVHVYIYRCLLPSHHWSYSMSQETSWTVLKISYLSITSPLSLQLITTYPV